MFISGPLKPIGPIIPHSKEKERDCDADNSGTRKGN